MDSSDAQITTRTAVVEKDGLITRAWFQFFDKIRTKANVIVGTQTTSAIAGAATALPATPEGYMTIKLEGVEYKVPYYK